MKEYRTILVEKVPPVGKIIYNRPEKRNPMTVEMVDEASDAFLEFEKDNEVRVIILTHKGPVFTSGMPLSDLFGKSEAEIIQITSKFGEYSTLIERDITKPIISVSDGGLPLTGDILIISDRTSIQMPGINIGLV